MKVKVWMKRATRTFLQSFVGTFTTGLVTAVSGISDLDTLKIAFISLGASAVASGLAAVMNLHETEPVK